MGADPEYGVRHACSRGCHEPNTRAVEREHVRREVRQQISVDLEPQECPKCGWYDYHPKSVLGRICVWCRTEWS